MWNAEESCWKIYVGLGTWRIHCNGRFAPLIRKIKNPEWMNVFVKMETETELLCLFTAQVRCSACFSPLLHQDAVLHSINPQKDMSWHAEVTLYVLDCVRQDARRGFGNEEWVVPSLGHWDNSQWCSLKCGRRSPSGMTWSAWDMMPCGPGVGPWPCCFTVSRAEVWLLLLVPRSD